MYVNLHKGYLAVNPVLFLMIFTLYYYYFVVLWYIYQK